MRHHYTRDLFIFGSLLLFCTLFAHGQSFGPYTITGSQCATVSVGQNATAAFQVLGSWSGTIQPQIAVDGQAPANTQVVPAASTTKQSTVTANGAYVASTAGATLYLVCGNTVTGTAKIYVNLSPFIH